MRRGLRTLAASWLLAAGAAAQAQPAQVVDLPSRPGVTERMLVLQPADAAATVILLTGGHGRVEIRADSTLGRGRGNFLVRSRERFAAQGLATLVLDGPSDRADLDGAFRGSAEHMQDVGAAVRWARERFGKPVWLVGTSRGTQSAAAAGIALRGEAAPDGIVLSSTILGRSARARVTVAPVPAMDLAQLKIPVLVVHHAQDPCPICDPSFLPALMAQLPAGRAQLLTFEGGDSVGSPCEPRSHHGFNGIEDRVVAAIAAWIKEHR
jgi:pimeloyl-ACP methyl ester carboxylesterase